MNLVRKYVWIFSVVIAIALWWVAYAKGIWGQTLLAGPGEVVSRLMLTNPSDSLQTQNLYEQLAGTLNRALEGWVLGLLLGAIGGVLIGQSRLVYSASEPVIEFIRAVPPVLAFPLLLVAFNYTHASYVWTIVFGCAPVMFLTVAQGVLAMDRKRLEIFAVYQKSGGWRLVARIMEILPSFFLGARITFSLSLIVAVVTEMVFTPRSGPGIGGIARDAEASFQTPTFYAAVLLIGVCGFVGSWLLQQLETRLGELKN
jgi:taurine transport system permease protein